MRHDNTVPRKDDQLTLWPEAKAEPRTGLPDAAVDLRSTCLSFCTRCGQPNPGLFCPRCGHQRCASCGDI